jgi:hypothetical protein
VSLYWQKNRIYLIQKVGADGTLRVISTIRPYNMVWNNPINAPPAISQVELV